MKTWTEYLALIRLTNGDVKTPYKISDDDYLTITNFVMSILSRDAGAKKSIALSGSGPTFSLPDDFVHDRYLIADDGNKKTLLRHAAMKPGDVYGATSKCPTSYVVGLEDDDTLTVMAEGCNNAITYTLYYKAMFGKVLEAGSIPVDGWREVALMYLVMAYSLAPTEYKRARLEQYASAPELKVLNPPATLAELYRERYREMIAMQVSK